MTISVVVERDSFSAVVVDRVLTQRVPNSRRPPKHDPFLRVRPHPIGRARSRSSHHVGLGAVHNGNPLQAVGNAAPASAVQPDEVSSDDVGIGAAIGNFDTTP